MKAICSLIVLGLLVTSCVSPEESTSLGEKLHSNDRVIVYHVEGDVKPNLGDTIWVMSDSEGGYLHFKDCPITVENAFIFKVKVIQ